MKKIKKRKKTTNATGIGRFLAAAKKRPGALTVKVVPNPSVGEDLVKILALWPLRRNFA